MERDRNYWGYRICTEYIDFFAKELNLGRLRQGWGYNEGQDLRNMTYDGDASRNLRMLEVKKGDYLLVPRLPEWDYVAIVEATEDWRDGYKFEIDEDLEDFGHIFPAKIICVFNRHSEVVSGDIRSTLKNLGRFWNIKHLADDIETIVESKGNENALKEYQSVENRLAGTIENCYKQIFNKDRFEDALFQDIQKQFQASEWEDALVCGLKELFPEPIFTIERTGGITEDEHGTDVVIKFSNPLSQIDYIIAIQIKDYKNMVWNIQDIINQTNKASYWDKNGYKLIEKILIVTQAEKEQNIELVTSCKENNITLIMGKELKGILAQIGLKRIVRNFPYSEQ